MKRRVAGPLAFASLLLVCGAPSAQNVADREPARLSVAVTRQGHHGKPKTFTQHSASFSKAAAAAPGAGAASGAGADSVAAAAGASSSATVKATRMATTATTRTKSPPQAWCGQWCYETTM